MAPQLLGAMKMEALETKEDFVKIVKQVVAKQKLDNVFTASFDKRTYNLKPKNMRRVIQTRFHKTENFSVDPLGLRAAIGKLAISRKQLAVCLGRAIGPLQGRNILAIMELACGEYLSKHAKPTFAACIMGPGAIAGANLLLGKLKGAKTSGVGLADCKLRSLLRAELKRLRRVQVRGGAKQNSQKSLRSGIVSIRMPVLPRSCEQFSGDGPSQSPTCLWATFPHPARPRGCESICL